MVAKLDEKEIIIMPRYRRAPKGKGLPSSVELTNAETDAKDVYKNEVTGYICGEWVDHVKDLSKVPAAARELSGPGFNLSKFGATVCGIQKVNGHLCGHTIPEGGSGQMRRHLEEKHGIKVNTNSRSQVNEDEIFAGRRGLIRMILHREWHDMPFIEEPFGPLGCQDLTYIFAEFFDQKAANDEHFAAR